MTGVFAAIHGVVSTCNGAAARSGAGHQQRDGRSLSSATAPGRRSFSSRRRASSSATRQHRVLHLAEEQLAQRFKVPVRYVVYSHSHFDHAEGGAVFADTAQFVAHRNMLRNMDGRYPHARRYARSQRQRRHRSRRDQHSDEDASRRLRLGPNFFQTWDHNKDGTVSPAELQRDIRRPDIVYSDRMRLELWRPRRRIDPSGLNHSDDATVMYFRRSAWCLPPNSSRTRW